MSQVEEFLRDLDGRWRLGSGRPLTLRLLGSTALTLQTDYARGTKDGDILETPEITEAVSAEQPDGLQDFGGGLGRPAHSRGLQASPGDDFLLGGGGLDENALY